MQFQNVDDESCTLSSNRGEDAKYSSGVSAGVDIKLMLSGVNYLLYVFSFLLFQNDKNVSFLWPQTSLGAHPGHNFIPGGYICIVIWQTKDI